MATAGKALEGHGRRTRKASMPLTPGKEALSELPLLPLLRWRGPLKSVQERLKRNLRRLLATQTLGAIEGMTGLPRGMFNRQFTCPWAQKTWLSASLQTWINDFDFEELVVRNSNWRQQRVQVIKDGAQSDFRRFCLVLAVYFFGSDAMVEALAAHKASFHDETLQDNCHKNVAWLYDHALKNCTAAARRPVATGAASQEVRVTRTTGGPISEETPRDEDCHHLRGHEGRDGWRPLRKQVSSVGGRVAR